MPVTRLNKLPMTTTAADVMMTLVAALDNSRAQLAGLAVMAPTFSAESLQMIASVKEDLVKSLDRGELPSSPAAAGLTITGRELPWPTIVAFAAGGVMLVALVFFAGALVKLSLADARRDRRLRRRYVP
jgi:hypothetical protein